MFSHPPLEGSVLLANNSSRVAQVPLPSAGTVAVGLDLTRCSERQLALAGERGCTLHFSDSQVFFSPYKENSLRSPSNQHLKSISQSLNTEQNA